jgi:hypothetical protein
MWPCFRSDGRLACRCWAGKRDRRAARRYKPATFRTIIFSNPGNHPPAAESDFASVEVKPRHLYINCNIHPRTIHAREAP